MKILHTADWHLGVRTEGKLRIKEQKKIMDEICAIADEEKVDVVLVAGDIFDQPVPVAVAEDLFYETLDKLTLNKERVVVVIAGNHDDPKRLTAGVYFAKKHNAIIVGDLCPKVDKKEGEKLSVESLDEGSIRVSLKSARGIQYTNIATLPYPAEYRFEEKSDATTYAGKVEEWARKVCKGFSRGGFNILLSHLMLVGATLSKNNEEKIVRVGDINAVGRGDLPKADYYALGHLHSHQIQKGHYVYSGAPIYLDVNQKTAGVVIVEGNNQGLRSVKYKEIKSTNIVKEVEIEENEVASEVLKEFSDDDIINVTFIQKSPLKSEFVQKLKQKFPCVRQVRLRRVGTIEDDKNYVCDRRSLDPETLFNNFYKSKKFALPSREVLALFKELVEDI